MWNFKWEISCEIHPPGITAMNRHPGACCSHWCLGVCPPVLLRLGPQSLVMELRTPHQVKEPGDYSLNLYFLVFARLLRGNFFGLNCRVGRLHPLGSWLITLSTGQNLY